MTDRWTHHRRSSDLNTGIRESQLDAYLNRVLKQPRLFASESATLSFFRSPPDKRHSDRDVGFREVLGRSTSNTGQTDGVAFLSRLMQWTAPTRRHLGTADGGDYTVHVVVGLDPDWNLYVLDLWRKQASSDEWVESFCDLVKAWKPESWAEETGQIKSGVGPFLQRRMMDRQAYVVRQTFPTRGDKAIRAQAIRGRMALHGLYIPINAPWAAEFKRELLTFPAGKHDDQVDAIGLIGQLLDHIWRGSKPKEPEKKRFEYEGNGPVIIGNVPIRELIQRKERARMED